MGWHHVRATLAMVSDAEWRVSDEEWDGTVKDFKKVIKLVMRATATIEEAQRQGYDDSLIPFVREDIVLLLKNKLPRRRRRAMIGMLGFIESWLEKKAKAADAGVPPPAAPRAHSSLRDVK